MSQPRSRLPRLLLLALAVGGLGWITPGGGLVGVLLGVGALSLGFLLGSPGAARTGSPLGGAVEPLRPQDEAATPPPPGGHAGRVVHDLNNVLTVISGRAELLLDVLPSDHPAREDVLQIRRAGRDAIRIAARLSRGGHPDRTAPELVAPGRLVQELLPGLRSLLNGDQTLTLRVEEPLPLVAAGRPEVEQVLGNLVRNAGQGMPGGGTVTLSLSSTPGWLSLVVEDSGVGMSDEVRRQAFDPFFSGWPEGGSGIGLSTVQGLVRRMGGGVELENRSGGGSRVQIRLPAAAATDSDPEPEESAPRWNSAGETVLVVEDDPVLRVLAERILLGRGYHVIPAGSGAEALDMAADPALPIDLVLSDVVLPGMGGPETVGRLEESGRRFRVLYMSGYNDDHLAPYGVMGGGVELLRKPFDPEALARKVREVLDA
jgi:two-component system, cell cycle sensor histidine kinase and response regulator CckA